MTFASSSVKVRIDSHKLPLGDRGGLDYLRADTDLQALQALHRPSLQLSRDALALRLGKPPGNYLVDLHFRERPFLRTKRAEGLLECALHPVPRAAGLQRVLFGYLAQAIHRGLDQAEQEAHREELAVQVLREG